MSKKLELKCQTFHYLTVLDNGISISHRMYFTCKCKCGKVVIVMGKHLKSGNTKSCGCRRTEGLRTTHGMKHSRIYNIWCAMKQRCNYKKAINYKNYGARGIKVCKDWSRFENFHDDMIDSYNHHVSVHGESNTSLDRINNNGNYSKSNCRWATRSVQYYNSRCVLKK